MLQLGSSPDDLSTAVKLLAAGEIVALPFETVYGLAADATNPDALRRIFLAKGRPGRSSPDCTSCECRPTFGLGL